MKKKQALGGGDGVGGPHSRYTSQVQGAMEGGERLKLTHLFGGIATYFPGERFGTRTLKDFELVWIIAGGARYTHDQVTYELVPGDVLLARPGFVERYEWAAGETSRHGFFHFGVGMHPGGWGDAETWPDRRTLGPGHPIFGVLEHLLERWRAAGFRKEGPDPRLEAIFQTAVDMYLWDPMSVVHEQGLPEPVVAAVDFLRGMLRVEVARRISLDELAKAAGVTAKHLCRLFQGHMGLSPMEYYRLLRLEFALMRMQDTGLSLKRISDLSGFSSSYHFSRAFSAAYGLPPSEVRKGLHAGVMPPVGPLGRLKR